MGKLTRFGVSLDEDLLESFDSICEKKKYDNRSEAIRDLIRQMISEEKWGHTGSGCGTLTLMFDHHRNDLARKLMGIEHEFHDIIVVSTHVHLDHNNCLETLVIKGDCGRVRDLSQQLISCKGVKYGVFNLVPDGGDIS